MGGVFCLVKMEEGWGDSSFLELDMVYCFW